MKVLSILILMSLSGCRFEKPRVIYMPDMVYGPALKAQQPGAQRVPVPGTLSQDFHPYPYSQDAEKAGVELKNPLKPTRQVLMRGAHVFNTYCIVCHGPRGEGDGSIVPHFPRPPSLQTDRVRQWPDGKIYHVITVGQNLMPSYAAQIPSEDRWAAVHYVRVLQRSLHPTPEDLLLLKKQESP